MLFQIGEYERVEVFYGLSMVSGMYIDL